MNKMLFLSALAVMLVAFSAYSGLISHYEFQGNLTNSIVGGGDGSGVAGAGAACPADPNVAPYPFEWPTICHADLTGLGWIHVGYPGVLYNIENNQKLTIAMWIRSYDYSYAQLFGRRYQWRMYIQDGSPALGILGSNGSIALVGNQIVTDGRWNHIAATYDGTTGEAIVYVNGVQDAALTQTDPIVYVDSTLRTGIGAVADTTTGGSHIYNGLIDDIRIYDEVLSEFQIYDIYKFTDEPEFCISPPMMDFTGDCKVGIEDLKMFLADWLESGLIEIE